MAPGGMQRRPHPAASASVMHLNEEFFCRILISDLLSVDLQRSLFFCLFISQQIFHVTNIQSVFFNYIAVFRKATNLRNTEN